MDENWEALPRLLSGHLLVTLCAMAAGAAISLPIGVLAAFVPKLRTALLSVASVLQTIPGLALLALMVPLLGIGFLPALIALTVYSILPMIRNTVTGLTEIDPAVIEAARGVGMTPGQMLWKVQLPLAAPVILAGVRTAATWVVGTAVLATPIGFDSLGDYIFRGLQLQNYATVIFGCIAAAALAITLDQLLALTERGLRLRQPLLVKLSGAALLAIMVGGVYPRFADGRSAARQERESSRQTEEIPPEIRNSDPIVIAGKPFTEQYILLEVLRQQLSSRGFTLDIKTNMGSTVLFEALKGNQIDVYIDYSGTLWATILKENGTASRERVLIECAAHLLSKHGIVLLGPLGFENAYSLAMDSTLAKELDVRTIGDLAPHLDTLSFAGDYEFFGRAEWKIVKERYGFGATEEISMDPSLRYQAAASGNADVISAYSTDGRIAAFDLKVLADPEQAFPPYDAVILLSPAAAENRTLINALRPLLESISNESMREANRMADVEKSTPKEAAAWLMTR